MSDECVNADEQTGPTFSRNYVGRFIARGMSAEDNSDKDMRHIHFFDEDGNPAGGSSRGIGFAIRWQNGPLNSNLRNGAFVEDVIKTCVSRLRFFQSTEFQCIENQQALEMLNEALLWLEHRTADRVRRGVEGTHER